MLKGACKHCGYSAKHEKIKQGSFQNNYKGVNPDYGKYFGGQTPFRKSLKPAVVIAALVLGDDVFPDETPDDGGTTA